MFDKSQFVEKKTRLVFWNKCLQTNCHEKTIFCV